MMIFKIGPAPGSDGQGEAMCGPVPDDYVSAETAEIMRLLQVARDGQSTGLSCIECLT